MRGIIVLHYWNSHTSLLESQAIKSAYKFLEVEDKHTPILSHMVTRLQEACELCGRSWENDFHVRIIKEATAGVNIEQPVAIADLTPDQRLSGLLE